MGRRCLLGDFFTTRKPGDRPEATNCNTADGGVAEVCPKYARASLPLLTAVDSTATSIHELNMGKVWFVGAGPGYGYRESHVGRTPLA